MSNTPLSKPVKNARIVVIGRGYVGLPLAIEFRKKYDVLGFDINAERVAELQEGKDRTQEANIQDLQTVMAARPELDSGSKQNNSESANQQVSKSASNGLSSTKR